MRAPEAGSSAGEPQLGHRKPERPPVELEEQQSSWAVERGPTAAEERILVEELEPVVGLVQVERIAPVVNSRECNLLGSAVDFGS